VTPDASPTARANALTRFVDFISRHGRFFTVANIYAQGGLIVTGGAVRLTASGLGCSAWPMCEPGEFTPQFHEATSLHPFIEFGNRTLTGVLLIVALGVAISVWRTRPDLKRWGLFPLAGVAIQAVVGGVTVLTGLNPVAVAPHFLLSALLVWQGTWLALRYRNAPRREGRCIKKPLRISTFLLFVLTVLGTLTTGAGPHSGDADATERLGLDPAAIARVHALTVWAFVAVLAYIVFRVRKDRSAGPRDEVRKAWVVLVTVTLLQGAIGYVQYFTGLPELIVGAHLAGAAILTAAHSAAHYLLRRDRNAVSA